MILSTNGAICANRAPIVNPVRAQPRHFVDRPIVATAESKPEHGA